MREEPVERIKARADTHQRRADSRGASWGGSKLRTFRRLGGPALVSACAGWNRTMTCSKPLQAVPTLDQLWHFNVGSGINAPPMTFEVNGKQYVVIQSGLNRNALAVNSMTPELREMRNQAMLFVFGL
jgi:hypothetical protein